MEAPVAFVYLVRFTSGVVKVGYAKDVKSRIKGYEASGVIHGNPVTDTWVSPAHERFRDNETALIDFCAQQGPRVTGRDRGEYFEGVNFSALRARAEALDYTTTQHQQLADDLTPQDFNFSELVQAPRKVTEELGRHRQGVRLRRRGEGDLYLSRLSDHEGQLAEVEALCSLMAGVGRRGPGGRQALRAAATQAFPWASSLSDGEIDRFTEEFLGFGQAGAQLGSLNRAAAVMKSWEERGSIASK